MKHMKNILFLLLADIIWGAAFVSQRVGGDAVGAYSFTAIRSLIGFFVLLPVVLLRRKAGRAADRRTALFDRKLLAGGLICGTALCFATNFQQFGITLGASVGKAGFLTACYILLVPVLGLFLGKKCPWNVWLGIFISLAGLYLLCCTDRSLALTLPDLLLLLCAFSFAVQILSIDHFAPFVDAVELSCAEFLVCGLLSLIPTFWVDMAHSSEGIAVWVSALTSWKTWIPLLYAGVCSNGIAYTCQVAGQRDFNPAIASLCMSLESVFSIVFGWLLLHENLTGRELFGCLIIFAAVILAQLPDSKTKFRKI